MNFMDTSKKRMIEYNQDQSWAQSKDKFNICTLRIQLFCIVNEFISVHQTFVYFNKD
jgi:hypothetical protein